MSSWCRTPGHRPLVPHEEARRAREPTWSVIMHAGLQIRCWGFHPQLPGYQGSMRSAEGLQHRFSFDMGPDERKETQNGAKKDGARALVEEHCQASVFATGRPSNSWGSRRLGFWLWPSASRPLNLQSKASAPGTRSKAPPAAGMPLAPPAVPKFGEPAVPISKSESATSKRAAAKAGMPNPSGFTESDIQSWSVGSASSSSAQPGNLTPAPVGSAKAGMPNPSGFTIGSGSVGSASLTSEHCATGTRAGNLVSTPAQASAAASSSEASRSYFINNNNYILLEIANPDPHQVRV